MKSMSDQIEIQILDEDGTVLCSTFLTPEELRKFGEIAARVGMSVEEVLRTAMNAGFDRINE
jgi:hypothetical protein